MKIEPYDGRHDQQIASLVEAIRYKMAVHADKGQWDDVPLSKLLKGLATEVLELERAIDKMDVLEAIHECGDIGAYATMIIECMMRSRTLKPDERVAIDSDDIVYKVKGHG